MSSVGLIGRINDDGKLEVELPADLQLFPGEVRITIEAVEDIETEDAVWDTFYNEQRENLEALAHKAHEDYLAGRAKKIDVETDFNS